MPHDEALADLRTGWISRCLDDREIALLQQSRVYFQISGAGHEALLLGLAHSLRAGHDWFFPYYRDRALALALGVTPTEMLLQAVGARDDPASGGRQMPCHFGSRALNIVSQTSATGSQCLPAVGCAEAIHYREGRGLSGVTTHDREVVYVSLGEGTVAQGEFWEAVTNAAALQLPILFVIADNGYAISVRSGSVLPNRLLDMLTDLRGLLFTRLDGRDYFEVRRRGAATISHVRAGLGPALLHAIVTRPYSHSQSDDQRKYRTPDDLEHEAHNDPLVLWEQALVDAGVIGSSDVEALRDEAKDIVRAAADAALAAPRPDPSTVLDHVIASPKVTADSGEPVGEGAESGEPITLGEAIRLTLHEVMAADERVRVFGEDVADAEPDLVDQVPGKGGVFGITHGLQRAYGSDRCFNTPLAEATIIGRAVGQAVRGLRPCPEIQFFDYVWTAMQQLKTEAATMRWRSAGSFSCPMVVRIPIGGYLSGGAIWHSQCADVIFAHVPGLQVVFPSRARDAAGLLRTAFTCEDPVLFLEHKHLYRQGYCRDPMPPPGWMLPFGRAAHVMRGDRATVVSWGATLHRCAQAIRQIDRESADGSARAGRSGVDLIDLRTLSPWDRDTVAESVRRTGRLLVVHEDTLTAGFGAEVAAFVADECFEHLDAPVWRIGAADTHVAYEPTLERAILPQADDIARDLKQLIEY